MRATASIVTHTPGNDHRLASGSEAQRHRATHLLAYGVDVSDYESTQELARRIHADGHRIDILVNNAGITRDATLRKLDKASGMPYCAPTWTPCSTSPSRSSIRWSSVAGVAWSTCSSINGSKGQFGQTNYSAAKAGVHGFTKALAQEVAHKGVTVYTSSPRRAIWPPKMVMAVREDGAPEDHRCDSDWSPRPAG